MLISILVDPSQIADERLDNLTDQSNTLERWDDKNVLLLFECYQKLKGLLGKSNNTKKSVFNKIAEEFNLRSDLVVTGNSAWKSGKNWKQSTKRSKITISKQVERVKHGNSKRKWNETSTLERGMERDGYEVAIHLLAGYLGNSVRKFWLNGSRPMSPAWARTWTALLPSLPQQSQKIQAQTK